MWASGQQTAQERGISHVVKVRVGGVDIRTVNKVPAPVRRVRENSGAGARWH